MNRAKKRDIESNIEQMQWSIMTNWLDWIEYQQTTNRSKNKRAFDLMHEDRAKEKTESNRQPDIVVGFEYCCSMQVQHQLTETNKPCREWKQKSMDKQTTRSMIEWKMQIESAEINAVKSSQRQTQDFNKNEMWKVNEVRSPPSKLVFWRHALYSIFLWFSDRIMKINNLIEVVSAFFFWINFLIASHAPRVDQHSAYILQ